MPRNSAIIILTAILAACTMPAPKAYTRADFDTFQFDQDVAQCNYEAVKATSSAPVGSVLSPYDNNAISNDLALGMRRAEVQHACLEARGYRLE